MSGGDVCAGKNGQMLQSSRMFWGGLGQVASAAQVFFGLIVIMAAQKYLIHTGRTTGQVLIYLHLGIISRSACGFLVFISQDQHLRILLSIMRHCNLYKMPYFCFFVTFL